MFLKESNVDSSFSYELQSGQHTANWGDCFDTVNQNTTESPYENISTGITNRKSMPMTIKSRTPIELSHADGIDDELLFARETDEPSI